MDSESRTPNRTPRTTYAKLRDAANIRHDRKHRWELKPRDRHTRSERQRLANEAWGRLFDELVAQKA